MKRVVYQGIEGSFSHKTGVWYFGENAEFIGVHNFDLIFARLKSNPADYGVIPIENTLIGSIYKNYDLLFQNDITVIAEHYLKVEHNLLTLPGVKFSDIKKVYSHPKALEQCDHFFENNPEIEEVACFDTAVAAKLVSDLQNPSRAAIASTEAATLYGLSVLKPNIQDDKNNTTRFFVISQRYEQGEKVNKASLIFTVAHLPGSLFRALKIFADSKINLTKLESRPMTDRPSEYFFYIDFEFATNHLEEVQSILKKLQTETHTLKILGFYKKGSRSWVSK